MSSIIVLDSSDEDEAPSKRLALPRLNPSTTITIVNKPVPAPSLPEPNNLKKLKSLTNSGAQSNFNMHTKPNNSINISNKNTVISNTLLSPTTKATVSKPKLSTLPKINAAFTLNTTNERHTPTPPKKPTTPSTNYPTAAQQLPQQQNRKRKTSTPPKPKPISAIPPPVNNFMPSLMMMNSSIAAMMPMIHSAHSMAPSALPPLQLLATPTNIPMPPTSAAFSGGYQHRTFDAPTMNNSRDNFKIHLPLKQPNSTSNLKTSSASPTVAPSNTTSALRSIKRIKPKTLLKNSDEAWLKRQQQTPTSTPLSTSLPLQFDNVMDIFPTMPTSSPTASTSPASQAYAMGAQNTKKSTPRRSPSLPAKPVTPTPRAITPKGPLAKSVKLIPRPATPKKTASEADTPIRLAKHSPKVRCDETPVLDLTDSPEKRTTTKKTVVLPSPAASTSSANTTTTTTDPVTPRSNSKANGAPETPSSTFTNSSNITEEEETQKPREPFVPEYEELLKVCCEADPSLDMEKLTKTKLSRYYYSVHPDFVHSRGFLKQLRCTIERIKADPDLVYYNLKTIVEELKVRRKSTPVITSNDETSESPPSVTTGNVRTDEQIKKLNKALHIVKKRIEQLEESEVDWDDDDSSYMKVERFKKRACQIYEKICDLTGESKSALRLIRKPIQFKGTNFVQFNHTLQAYINQTKEFPDYFDVLHMLEHCNGVYSLGLAQFEMKHIAQDAFIKVGKLLQSRRKTDLYETVTHYTGNTKDPAAADPTLLAKLSENQKLKKNINEVLAKYAREQDINAEEIKLKKAATAASNANAAKTDKPVENKIEKDAHAAENKAEHSVDDDDDDDEDEEDEEEEDEEPIEIEDDVEKLSNGEITDEDSDIEIQPEISSSTTATTNTNNSDKSATREKQTKDEQKFNIEVCDINILKMDANQLKSSGKIKNNSNENEKFNPLLQSGHGRENTSVLKQLDIRTPTALNSNQHPQILPNGNITKSGKAKDNFKLASPVGTTVTPGLKVISVCSLNENIKHAEISNKAVTEPPKPPPAIVMTSKLRTVAEIVISDEES